MQNTSHPEGFNKNILLAVVLITSFINPFLAAAVNIALPKMAEEFSMNAITMSWVSMSFLLSSAVFMVPLGKVADILGRKRIFVYGNAIITISSLLCALSVSKEMLITFRIMQGIGGAMMFATGMALITSAFPPQERGKAIGINVSAVYLGLSVAPLVGGFLTQYFGWRSIFFATVPFLLLVTLLTILTIKSEWAEARHEKFDFTGSIVYMLAISSLMFGFSKLPDTYAIILTVIGVVGLIAFTYIELKKTYPVLDIRLFKNNKVFAFSNLAALINYAATFAITFLLSLYLQYIKGLSPQAAGMILVTQPIFMTLFASFSGKLSDTYDSRILSSAGMGIIVTGLIMLTFLSAATLNSYLIICLAILGIGFGLFSSPNTNAIMSSVEKKQLGVASATVGTMRLTGQMISLGIATLIIHLFLGEAKITPANHNQFLSSMRVLFILFSVLCFLGVFASLARGKVK
jgi:EmrB/QacA subfamily drug resistance transporter